MKKNCFSSWEVIGWASLMQTWDPGEFFSAKLQGWGLWVREPFLANGLDRDLVNPAVFTVVRGFFVFSFLLSFLLFTQKASLINSCRAPQPSQSQTQNSCPSCVRPISPRCTATFAKHARSGNGIWDGSNTILQRSESEWNRSLTTTLQIRMSLANEAGH